MKKNKKILTKSLLALTLLSATIAIPLKVSAASGFAFSAGKGYDNIDMTTTTNACADSYNRMGYGIYCATYDANYNVLNGSFTNGRKRLESDLVFLTGHGTENYVGTLKENGVKIGSSQAGRYVGTASIDWTKTKLVIFLACNTGKENVDNITYDVFKRSNWKTTTIGWHQTIVSTSADKFICNFNAKLETGATINQALNYAGSKSYADSKVKDLAIFGNGEMVVKKTRSAVNTLDNNTVIDESNITYITEDIPYDGTEEKLPAIINLLKQKDASFNINDYEVNIYNTSKENKHYTIEFTYKIGDIYTNSAYTVIVNYGKVVQIADNSIKVDKEKLDTNFKTSKENIAKEVGKSDAIKSNIKENINNISEITPVEIKKQETRKYIDLNTKKKYLQVFTTYSYENEEAIAENVTNYEI
ncbi:MAG: hypothetical protein HFJ28_01475 [Clostridia bacterium]|nr:hypothetical protein [Clostridia bacterium]